MSKKLEWPLAKLRKEDKCPAVWLSWGVWMAIRDGLVRTYLNAYESLGRSDARIAANKRDDILDAWRSYQSDAKNALEVYRLGYNFNVKEPSEFNWSPAKLVEQGRKLYEKAFDRQIDDMREGPKLENKPRY